MVALLQVIPSNAAVITPPSHHVSRKTDYPDHGQERCLNSGKGANQGVAYEAAKNLVLLADCHAILESRDSAKGEAASRELQLVELDVTDEKSVDVPAQRVEAG